MNIVLVQPEIPPNTGNVARLCAATGATLHLVGPLGFRLDDSMLKRAGMDYWEQVTWRYWVSFNALQDAAEKDEFRRMKEEDEKSEIRNQHYEKNPPSAIRNPQSVLPTFYFVENKTTRLYTEPRYKWGDYLVFGRETAGLPDDLLKENADTTIAIPMWNPEARSLNLSNCVAIVLYEAMRQIGNR